MGLDNTTLYDIAVLGAPFDTATTYRPGARFGPGGIRNGAQRLGGANRLLGVDPLRDYKIGESDSSCSSHIVFEVYVEKLS